MSTKNAPKDPDLLFLEKFQLLMIRKPDEKLIEFKLLKHEYLNEQKNILNESLKEYEKAKLSNADKNELLMHYIKLSMEDEAKFMALSELLNDELKKVARYFFNKCRDLDEKERKEKYPGLRVVKS
jgi:hypothetical protein